jgi:lipoprotein-anchoring transpeptidase ErfK/SrfK
VFCICLAVWVGPARVAGEPAAGADAPGGTPFLELIEEAGVYLYPCGTCEATRALTLRSPSLAGEDVAYIQEMLAATGYLEGPGDGVFGPVTARAVAAFQEAHELEPTGEVDLVTWEALADAAESPGVASAPPAPTGFVSILIDTQKLSLTVFSNGEVWRKFTIAAGKSGTPTPLGEWRISNKGVWSGGFGTRWLGLSVPFARYGIHGTNKPRSIGSHASHGCIRMRNRDVEILFRWAGVGTPVKIVGRARTHFGEVPRTIRPGYVGSDVMALQKALKEHGLYRYGIDGRFEAGTLKALREFQWAMRMRVTGMADKATREVLGLP